MNSFLIKIITIFSFLFIYSIESKNPTFEEIIKDALKNFNSNVPITKIYLHTDRLNYLAGETLYFKGYIINFHKHSFDSLNTNLYFELINPFKNIVFTKRFLIKNGISIGSITLPDTLIDGLYQLRAYTNFMRNFDEKYFFSQNIYIKNTTNKFSPYSLKFYKKFYKNYRKNKDKFFVKVFQENIIHENLKMHKIIVLTKNYFNEPLTTNVKLVNKSKVEILENYTNNLGLCIFYLKPSNDKYYILTSYKSNSKLIPLKFTHSNTPYFTIKDEKDLIIKIYNSPDYKNDKFHFLIHSYGEIILLKTFQTKDSFEIQVNKKFINPGLYTFTLFSHDFTILQEKLYANLDSFRNELIKINLYNNGSNTEKIIHIIANIDDPFLYYNLSVSINTDKEIYNNLNIYNYFLYGSDLGLNNNESSIIFSFFDKNFINNVYLSTLKWDRFLWNDLLNNNLPNINHKIEKGLTIEGKITSELFSMPLKNCFVKLYILNSYNDVYAAVTDENGKFTFENLYYYDDVDIKIEAFRPNHKRNLVILLPDKPIHKIENFYPEPTAYMFYEEIYNKNKTAPTKDIYANKIEVQEINDKEKDKNKIEGIYGTPDFIITSDQIPQGYSNVLQVIQGRVPGVDVSGNNVIIRGVKTIYGSTDPLYILDGVPVNDVNTILSIPVQDVDRIEIIKGPTSAIYGSRGANGIIAVYTKRGEFLKKGVVELRIQGFSKEIKFKQNIPNYNFPFTLYWEPNIILNHKNNQYIIKINVPQNIIKYNICIQGITNTGIPFSKCLETK